MFSWCFCIKHLFLIPKATALHKNLPKTQKPARSKGVKVWHTYERSVFLQSSEFLCKAKSHLIAKKQTEFGGQAFYFGFKFQIFNLILL